MNKIKLSINTSTNKNMTYYVFRSTKQEDLPSNLNDIRYHQPVITINEATAPKTMLNITREIILDVSYITVGNMIKYILNHTAVKTDKNDLTVKINFNNPDQFIQYESISLNLTFDATGNIVKLTVTDKDKTVTTYTDIDKINTIIKLDGQSIYIDNELTLNNYNVTCDYYIEVIEVEDYISNVITGISYSGPNAHGLKKPNITSTECFYEDINSVKIPYLRIAPNNTINGVIYYYIIVGVDPTLNVSNPSSLIAMNLNQDPSMVQYTLQVSDNYSIDNSSVIWQDICNTIKITDLIEVGRPGTETFATFGEIVSETVPVFATNEVIVNTNYVVSDNKLILSFPNVWYENNKYNNRPGKAYRLISNIDGNYSEPSDVINQSDTKNIPIEKIVIIKRNASNDVDASIPSTIGQTNTEIIKTYIRKDGLYYIPVDYDNAPYNVPQADSDIIIMSSKSIFDTMIIGNDSCVPGQKYNFTFYLFDSYGKQSEPITILMNL